MIRLLSLNRFLSGVHLDGGHLFPDPPSLRIWLIPRPVDNQSRQLAHVDRCGRHGTGATRQNCWSRKLTKYFSYLLAKDAEIISASEYINGVEIMVVSMKYRHFEIVLKTRSAVTFSLNAHYSLENESSDNDWTSCDDKVVKSDWILQIGWKSSQVFPGNFKLEYYNTRVLEDSPLGQFQLATWKNNKTIFMLRVYCLCSTYGSVTVTHHFMSLPSSLRKQTWWILSSSFTMQMWHL